MGQKLVFAGESKLRGTIFAAPHQRISERMVIMSILAAGETHIYGTTPWPETHPLIDALRFSGALIEIGKDQFVINTEALTSTALPAGMRLSREQIRLLFFALLGRFGRSAIPLASYPSLITEIHVFCNLFAGLGIVLTEDRGYLIAEQAPITGTLHLQLPHPYIEYTEQIIALSVLQQGAMIYLNNVSHASTIETTIELFASMGARVKLEGKSIVITGVEKLLDGEVTVPHDTYEVCMLAAAAALTNSDIEIKAVEGESVLAFLHKLRQAGVEYKLDSDSLHVWHSSEALQPFTVHTGFYPEIESKWSGILAVLASQVPGESEIVERVKAEGLICTPLLKEAGVVLSEALSEQEHFYPDGVSVEPHIQAIKVFGPTKLQPTTYDLAIVEDILIPILIALISKETVEITNAQILLEQCPLCLVHLQQLGAKVKVSDE